MLLIAPRASAQTTIWSATLTVKSTTTGLGCANADSGAECSSTSNLTDDDFTHGGTTYHFDEISNFVVGSNTRLGLVVDTAFSSDLQSKLTFHVGTSSFSHSNASFTGSGTIVTWFNHSLSWSAGNTVSLKLTVPDTTAPTVSSAAVNGTALTITYNENLDTNSVPALGQFTVTAAGSDQTPTGVTISGKTVTLTLGTAVATGQTVTVVYTVPTSNPIQDVAGNDAGALGSQGVANNTQPPTTSPPTTSPPTTSPSTPSGPSTPSQPAAIITSSEGVRVGKKVNDSYPITLEEGGSIVYREETINLPVTRDECMSPGNPAVIIPITILDRVLEGNGEITFLLSELSPPDPPPGFRMEGCTLEIDLGVELGEGETVSVCLPSSGGDEDIYYRHNEESEEWEVLLESRPETVNEEDVLCGDAGAVSLSGVFVAETVTVVEETGGGGCAVASADGEGFLWRGAVFNLLLIMSVLLLVPGMSRFGVYDRKAESG